MSYATLMVCLQAGTANTTLLRIVSNLAERLRAGVIGIAACQAVPLAQDEGHATREAMEECHRGYRRDLEAAEAEFRDALRGRPQATQWRSDITDGPLAPYVARQARACDLLVIAVDRTKSLIDGARHIDSADLVMAAGRPLLVVPNSVTQLTLDHVMVGWRDTRETRRATLDALPLLKAAGKVSVVEVVPEGSVDAAAERVQDVVSWLSRHDIKADGSAVQGAGSDSLQLSTLMSDRGADLIVAGAYGHDRLRETILGGVTRHLLTRSDHCALLGH